MCEQVARDDAAVGGCSDGSGVAILKFCLVRIVVLVVLVAGGK